MATIAFALPALDADVTLSTAGTLASELVPVATTDATAVFYVKTSDMKNVFKFQTDALDINDVPSSDLKYYVFRSEWPLNLKLNPAHAMMDAFESAGALGTAGSVDANKNLLKHDFLRYLSLKLFRTIHGVDLFNNESALLENVALNGHNVKTSIEASLDAINTTAAGVTTADGNGLKYLTNDTTANTNICRELLRQVAYNAPTRFANIAAGGADIQSVPLIDGDSFNIKLTVNAADGQNSVTTVDPIPARTYNIKLVLKPDLNAVNTPVVDSSLYGSEYPYPVFAVPAPISYAGTNFTNVFGSRNPTTGVNMIYYNYDGAVYNGGNIEYQVSSTSDFAVVTSTVGGTLTSSGMGNFNLGSGVGIFARVHAKSAAGAYGLWAVFDFTTMPYLRIGAN
jgi:hypothetical protein